MKLVLTPQPTPEDRAMMERVFESTCCAANIQRRGLKAELLARFIAEEFALGNCDEQALSECALWLVRRRKAAGCQSFQRSIDTTIYLLD